MLLRLCLLWCVLLSVLWCHAQSISQPTCAQKEYSQQLYRLHPELKAKHAAIENNLLLYRKKRQTTSFSSMLPNTGNVALLPVVIHIVHNNGAENISDAQVKQGIQYLNEAYAALGYYNNGNSTNVQVQFCMAQRDPQGNATTGITRDVSPYTVMSGGDDYSKDDPRIKSFSHWNPENYINIWLVNSIPGNVVGYSTLPEAHGTQYEGIVMEAAYFGSTRANTVVLIHELGHYLGLYHTFDGGCTNNNCSTDGDMVCDTPPDQSTAYIGCDASMNSCKTDALSGFNSDQPDLTQDYMDYGNFDCMKQFTPGQVERMNWFIQNELFSLLHCNSCKAPCPTPATAAFAPSATNAPVNTNVTFSNHSVNAQHFTWFVDGKATATTRDFSTSFTIQGKHIITLQVSGNDPLCDSAVVRDTITITCPVKAGFSIPPGIIKINQPVTFTNTSSNAASYTWKVEGTVQSSSTDLTHTFTDAGIYTVTLVAKGVCTDSISQPINIYDNNGNIPEDICKPVTFQKIITTNNQIIMSMNITRDSGYILCGKYAVPFVDGIGGAYLLKLSKAGGFEWARYINPQSNQELDKIYEEPDGGFIGCGKEYNINSTTLTSKAIVMKFDARGNVLWAKRFGLQNSLMDAALDITRTSDGGYAFCGVTHDDDFRLTDWLVVKMDARGNVTWSKTLDNGFYERAYRVIPIGDTLVVSGIRTTNIGPRSEAVILKMRAADGAVLQGEVVGMGNRSVDNVNIYRIPGGYLVGAESVQDGFYYADMDQLALQLDDNLQPLRAAKAAIDIFGSPVTALYPTADGGFVTSRISQGFSNYEQTDSCWLMLAKIAPDWHNVDFIRKYPLASTEGRTMYTPRAVYPTPDGGYIFGETTTKKEDYGEHARLIKTDSKGNTPGCRVEDMGIDMQVPALTYKAFSFSTITNVTLNNPASTTLAITENKQEKITLVQRCSTSDCDYVTLEGNPKVCSMADTITYRVNRNAACVSSVLWQIDTTVAGIIATTDTTISLKFKQAGKTRLSATIFTACKLLQDSMDITVNNSDVKLNLGPDVQLCKESVVKLSAGKGFNSYHWNTGMADSTITVYTPGKYYVTVTDNCDNVFSDTVMVNLTQAKSLNLTAQLQRCNQDSLTLTAAEGFKSYSWSPAYNINNTSAGVVKVWPLADTTYTVTAQLNDYCTVTDSTRVRVLRSAPISIGNDTDFCAGGSVTLQAPAGFNGYQWQDGSTGTEFTATQKGTYTLAALNDNGCYSKSSMQVTEVYSLPPLNLGKDGRLCVNNTILHAGKGQVSYVWQDGSADSMFTVNATGSYWVTVTGNHGCTNSDTIVVTGFYPVPSGFLIGDTSFCSNGSVILAPTGRWAAYRWFNNNTTTGVTVNQPGQYWLQVTDYNGCTAKDTVTVTVKNDCPQVLYFPTAFTPNGDNVNDVFKPFTGAPLQQYHLVIYNRWGQKIFENSDAFNGWDGRQNNTAVPAGTYVYFCTYRFYNQPAAQVKGTVALLR